MRVLFDGKAPVHYGQIYVTSSDLPDMDRAFAGPEGTTGDDATSDDAILRQTSDGAAYWHTWARAMPPPPVR